MRHSEFLQVPSEGILTFVRQKHRQLLRPVDNLILTGSRSEQTQTALPLTRRSAAYDAAKASGLIRGMTLHDPRM